MSSSEEISAVEVAIKDLRVLYEKYFAGVDRIEPLKQREDVRRMLNRLVSSPPRNTALRFRLNSAQASMVTHEQHWNRIVRQIEEGTWRRDKFLKKTGKLKTAPEKLNGQSKDKQSAAYPNSIVKLHDAFNKARSQTAGNNPVSIEALAETVKRQYAEIKKKYNCKTVEFKVGVREGKAYLKAIPRNE